MKVNLMPRYETDLPKSTIETLGLNDKKGNRYVKIFYNKTKNKATCLHFLYFYTLHFLSSDPLTDVLIKNDEICKEFELIYTGEAKDAQASRLGLYKKQLTLVNDRISYYNQEKRQYLYWVKKENEPGYWMVGGDLELLSLNDCDYLFIPNSNSIPYSYFNSYIALF